MTLLVRRAKCLALLIVADLVRREAASSADTRVGRALNKIAEGLVERAKTFDSYEEISKAYTADQPTPVPRGTVVFDEPLPEGQPLPAVEADFGVWEEGQADQSKACPDCQRSRDESEDAFFTRVFEETRSENLHQPPESAPSP